MHRPTALYMNYKYIYMNVDCSFNFLLTLTNHMHYVVCTAVTTKQLVTNSTVGHHCPEPNICASSSADYGLQYYALCKYHMFFCTMRCTVAHA